MCKTDIHRTRWVKIGSEIRREMVGGSPRDSVDLNAAPELERGNNPSDRCPHLASPTSSRAPSTGLPCVDACGTWLLSVSSPASPAAKQHR